MLENNQKEIILLKDLGLINISPTRKKRFGLYKCYCGNEFKTRVENIKSKNTKSCGCYNLQIIRDRNIKNSTHKMTNHRLYSTWHKMMKRCYNKNNPSYIDYGDRGITVCERWHDVKNFIEDMYPTYKEGLTIDRKENDLGYSKDNCRWSNRTIQSRNKRIIQKNNTSGYKGVYKSSKNRYKASIGINNKRVNIGSYVTIIEAAKAYNNYIINNGLEHGLNIIEEN